MNSFTSPLDLIEWGKTRDTLHKYCRLVGAIREALSNPLPDAIHTNLVLCRKGFTTSAMYKNESSPEQTFEVILDVKNKKLRIESNYREPLSIALTGQSLNALCDETCSLLTDIGIKPPLERPSFLDGTQGTFDPKPITAFWKIITTTNNVLKKLKSELTGKTSPIQLRVDNFTLSVLWYCKKVFRDLPVEQIEFGFSTGDEKLGEACFFIKAFPEAATLKEIIPDRKNLRLSKDGSEMILLYSEILNIPDGEEKLLEFYRRVLK